MSLKKKFNKKQCKVTFSLPKKATMGATNVKLVGEFNEWNTNKAVMMKPGKTNFEAVVELPVGRDYQFRYLINDTVWENDWNADNYVATPFGVDNSVVYVRETKAGRKTIAMPATKKATVKKTTVAKAKVAKDNLKKIEGVGPKIEKLMNAAGIMTWADLSKAKMSTLKNILAEAGPRFKMHNPKTWAKQAKMAANGDWNSLAKWQAELNGGK